MAYLPCIWFIYLNLLSLCHTPVEFVLLLLHKTKDFRFMEVKTSAKVKRLLMMEFGMDIGSDKKPLYTPPSVLASLEI